MENNWLRFPTDVVDWKIKTEYEITGEDIPSDNYIESYVDIRIDSIVQIRPYFERDDAEGKLTGTILYTTSGENWVVNVHPKVVREILNCKPLKIPSIKDSNND